MNLYLNIAQKVYFCVNFMAWKQNIINRVRSFRGADFLFFKGISKKGLKIWRFCELPMKEKISSFIAVFVFFHGLSMKGKKLLRKFRELPRQMAVPVAYK